MDFSLNAVEQDLLARAKKLAAEFKPRARHYDETAEFPAENFQRLKDEGLLKLTVPPAYGGYGLWSGDKYLGFYLVLETLAAGCSTTGQLLQVHCHCTSNIAALASEAQKRRILADVVENGALVGSSGDAGQNIANGKADLRPVEGGFRLTTRSSYASLSAAAKYLMVYAAAPGARTFGEAVTLCVPRDAPSLTLHDTWSDAVGMRASVSWTISLDDVFIPWDWVIGQPGDFVRDPRGWTLAYAANYLGTAQGVFDFVVEFLKDKPNLTSDAAVATTLADMSSALQATRTSLWYACWLWEQRDYAAAELASLRVGNAAKTTALLVTTKAFEICGARSAFRDFPLDRAFRDVRMYTLHTRESKNARLLTNAIVTGDFHAKQWFSDQANRLTWEHFGVVRPRDGEETDRKPASNP